MNSILPYPLGFDTSVLAGRVGPSTIAMYTRDFKAFLTFAEMPERAKNAVTLEQWITDLVTHTDMSPNTINRMISAVKKVIGLAARQGYLTNETAESFNRVEGVTQSALKHRMRIRNRVKIEPDLMRKIIESFNTDTLIGKRNKAMFATLASSGIRVNELVTLQYNQIVMRSSGYLLILRAEHGKNLTEDREANISPEAVEAIKSWLDARPVQSEYIFTSFREKGGGMPVANHISTVGAWKVVKMVFEQHGIPNVKPHDLRRFVGTQLAKDDIRKAQKALGHKRIETTTKYDLNEIQVGATDNLF